MRRSRFGLHLHPALVILIALSITCPNADTDAAILRDPTSVWRAAETRSGVTVGAEIHLRGDELLSGTRGIGFSPTGEPLHVELVTDADLEGFLDTRLPDRGTSPPNLLSDHALCEESRFLLNDPRVGLFHNQRLSYETALNIARSIRRVLVMPGFFKFPHPDAFDGTQWVPVSQLYDWPELQKCGDVIELSDLITRCGSSVLDEHITLPFETLWMQSKTKAPWINGTRPDLKWQPFAGGEVVHLRSKATQPVTQLKLVESSGHMLRAFLANDVASARTVRAHALIAVNVTLGLRQQCFIPGPDVVREARSIVSEMKPSEGEPLNLLGIHLRIFKRSTEAVGGYLQEELATMQESLCNLAPEEFSIIASSTLAMTFGSFWPTHTFFASNEADLARVWEYLAGFPGPRINPYTPAQYAQAVTTKDCLAALRSILVDAMVLAQAKFFIGNVCSTMSEYVVQLRLSLGHNFTSNFLLGGVQHASLLEASRKLAKERGPDAWVQ